MKAKGRILKKLLSLTICLIMILGSVAVGGDGFAKFLDNFVIKASATTYNGSCGTNATWSYDTGTAKLTISGTGAMTNYSFGNLAPWHGYSVRKITINSGITSIGNYAFYDCDCSSAISIPSTVTSIGEGAFYDTRIYSINLPSQITTIGGYAFEYCYALRSITLPSNLTSLGTYAFYQCKNLASVTIPDKVTTISADCFEYCENLSSVTIPKSVTTISNYAFNYCTSLSDVYYADTASSWNSISIGYSNQYLTSATKHYALPVVTSTPTASLATGNYTTEQTVSLSCSTYGATIYYTTDGTAPTTSSNKYTGAFKINKSTTLKAIAVKDGYSNSEIFTAYYVINSNYCAIHNFDDNWVTVKEATCTEKGFKYRVCTDCEFIETSDIEATGHTWNSNYTIDKEATCTAEGSKSIHCSKCDAVKDATAIAKKEHSYGEWVTVKEVTCTEDGVKMRTCTDCGCAETGVIEATGHDWDDDYTIDKEATCAADGSKSIHCSKCDVVKYVTAIEKEEHCYGEWITVKEATCTEDGFKYRTCTDCGFNEISVISANGHTWDAEYTVDKAPTCTEDGSESIHCSCCDAVTDSRVIARKGHTYSDWVITQNPTPTTEGKMQRVCSDCGYIDEDIIPVTIPDYPTSVTLDKDTVTLSMGATATLTATVYPDTATDKSVTWTTSDSSVATVDNGVITAVAPGFALITVSTVDDRYPLCTRTCSVYVTALNLSTSSADIDIEANLISGIEPQLNSLSEYIEVIDGCTLEYSTSIIGTGTTVNVVQDGKVVDSYTAVVFGDATGDSWYDGMDAMVVDCIVNGMLTKEDIGEAAWTAADCNHDGVIDELDVEILQQAGLLLAQVDQSKSSEELQTDSAYQEYLSLIDQGVKSETEPTEELTEEEPAEEETNSIFATIISLFSKIWEHLMKYLSEFI